MADWSDLNPYNIGQQLGSSSDGSNALDTAAQQGAQVTSDLAKRAAEAQKIAILEGAQQAANNLPAQTAKSFTSYLIPIGVVGVIVWFVMKAK